MVCPAANARWPYAPTAGLQCVKDAARSAVGTRTALRVSSTTSAMGVGERPFRLKNMLTAKRPDAPGRRGRALYHALRHLDAEAENGAGLI
jgi:hypothetical protein